MAKKKDKPAPEPKKEKEEDLFEEEILNRGDEDSDPEEDEGYKFEEEFPEEEEEEDFVETDDDYVTAKSTASHPCLRAGYCSRCEGDLDNPEGSCNCRCHDLA